MVPWSSFSAGLFAICPSPIIHLLHYRHCLQFVLGRLWYQGEMKKNNKGFGLYKWREGRLGLGLFQTALRKCLERRGLGGGGGMQKHFFYWLTQASNSHPKQSQNAIQHNIDSGPRAALKWKEPATLLKIAICSGRENIRKSAHYGPPDFLKQALSTPKDPPVAKQSVLSLGISVSMGM